MNALVLTLVLAAGPVDAPWPGFLGGGQRAGAKAIPSSWSPSEGIAWQAELPGYGQSSPVIAEGHVYVTSVEGAMKDTYHVVAISLADGAQVWKYSLESTDKVESTGYVSRAAPTPLITSGGAIVAFFESGDVVALSKKGELLWKRSLGVDYGKFKARHGLAASPLETGQGIVLLVDHEGPSYLLCVDKQSGETIWKVDRKSRASWSSPALVPVEGKPVIVCSSSGSVDGYEPKTGDLLFSLDDLGGNTSNTPLPFGDGRFLVGAALGREAEGATGKKSNLAVQVASAEGKLVPRVLWTAASASSSFGSPIIHQGQAYFVSRDGVLYCLDAETGKEHYKQRLDQSCWATPLGIGDRVYFFGKSGRTTVIAAGPKFKVLAENDLWSDATPAAPPTERPKPKEGEKGGPPPPSGPVLYGYAIAGDSIVFRRGDRLYCVRQGQRIEASGR